MGKKRMVAVIGIVAMLLLLWNTVTNFDNAKSGLDVFKALFWLIVASIALHGFIADYRKDRWPL